jgi:probable rRNA maturation factor
MILSEIEADDKKGIFFFEEDTSLPALPDNILPWLQLVVDQEKKKLDTVHYYFCSDAYLLELNMRHLNHNTYTDIISFPYSYEPISGEIYISLERVLDNSRQYNTGFEKELLRVIVHGLLHFCGYFDENKKDKNIMRKKEDHYLSLLD